MEILAKRSESEIFSAAFPEIETRMLVLCPFYFSGPYPGHLRSNIMVLLLLFTVKRRTVGEPEKGTKNVQK